MAFPKQRACSQNKLPPKAKAVFILGTCCSEGVKQCKALAEIHFFKNKNSWDV
jgi:hypothetical protein